ncbi:MAG: hypothetical protein B7X65_09660 [Polaromonas sp. 39-63-25]|nr:MAG: hypothetical protein B7Y60_12935 [Polaromonas sp. 35-63-35]OYZ19654.1 MAG: hypothetical protein B7Y28_10205 [Polaromonas sp. 16-63-31]OYZ80079.1 MAG: hypothetical protein B7Y09_06960 [Polaromonas sp. 24-63-21]OZA52197.1 MAG: hypothetical protein B7X88_05790 [Polaromonas sp. 17-63-33]OZA87772.1 MAG: hypothetical protein B7X65_09660 [Polaromonas sp. 39-63-25]
MRRQVQSGVEFKKGREKVQNTVRLGCRAFRISIQTIIAFAAPDCIVPCAAHNDIVARTCQNRVDSATGIHYIVSPACIDRVVAYMARSVETLFDSKSGRVARLMHSLRADLRVAVE